jgi:hypothetical protein
MHAVPCRLFLSETLLERAKHTSSEEAADTFNTGWKHGGG